MLNRLRGGSTAALFVTLASVCTGLTACGPGLKSAAVNAESQAGETALWDEGVGTGEVILCLKADGSIQDMESLDLWSSGKTYKLNFQRQALGLNDDTEDNERTYEAYTRNTLNYLESIDPKISKDIREISKEFSRENFRQGKTIVDGGEIPAAQNEEVQLPEKTDQCASYTVKRLFWKIAEPIQGRYNYKADLKLWQKTPERVKAALVLGESLRRLDFKSPQVYNAYIHSSEFEEFTPKAYVEFLEKFKEVDKAAGGDRFSVAFGDFVFAAEGAAFEYQGGEAGMASRLLEPKDISVGNESYKIHGFTVLDAKGRVLRSCMGDEALVFKIEGELPVFESKSVDATCGEQPAQE